MNESISEMAKDAYSVLNDVISELRYFLVSNDVKALFTDHHFSGNDVLYGYYYGGFEGREVIEEEIKAIVVSPDSIEIVFGDVNDSWTKNDVRYVYKNEPQNVYSIYNSECLSAFTILSLAECIDEYLSSGNYIHRL